MRVTREQAAANRERIIEAAGELFRSKGFSGIGVADIMKAAELTHGGFYGHFASKDDLIAQASRRSMQRAAQNWKKVVAESGSDAFAEGLEPLIDILSGLVGGRTKAARRRKAIAVLSELIGALMLSRAVGDAGLSDEILDAGRRELLSATKR